MPEWLQLFVLARFGRPLVLLVAWYVLLRAVASGLRLLTLDVSRKSAAAARGVLFATAAAATVAFVLIAVWYANEQRYYDFAEPTMPAVAWMFESGKSLYPPPDAPERYAHIYGPMAFIPHAAAMRLFGSDLRITKWVGAASGIAGLLLLLPIIGSRAGTRAAVMFTGCCALMLLVFRNAAFWPRPDSLELLCSSIGLAAAIQPSRAGWLLLGASAGVLWNLKFSGPLYSLPIFVLFLERTNRRHAALAIATAAGVALLPFVAFRNVSLTGYGTWILLSARNGVVWSTLRQNFEWVVYLLLPVAFARRAAIRQQRDARMSRPVALSLVLALSAVAVLAAKPGGGPYHLLPFLPVIAFLAAIQMDWLPFGNLRNDGLVPFAAFIAAAVLIALAQQSSFISTVRQIDAAGPIADVTRFSNQHPGAVIQIGYSSDERMTFIRPLVVYRSSVYLLDQPAIQEHQLAGVEIPKATEDMVRSCSVTYWLIPKTGEPFSASNRYPMMQGRALFGSGFRRAFLESYRRSDSIDYFDVWSCAAKDGQ